MRRFFLILLAALAFTGADATPKACIDVFKENEQTMREKGAVGINAEQGANYLRFDYMDKAKNLAYSIVFTPDTPPPEAKNWTVKGQCKLDSGDMVNYITATLPIGIEVSE